MGKKYIETKKTIGLAVLLSVILLLAGCQSEEKTTTNEKVNITETDPIIHTVEESPMNEDTPMEEENIQDEMMNVFKELSEYQFVFSSGVGAWQTMLNIGEDGTFKGEYSDTDMGAMGNDYPYGTVYYAEFEGKFTTPEKINDHTFVTTIEFIHLKHEVESEEIVDGIKFIYSEPNGLDGAKEIYIYTPEAPIKELPEGFRNWVGYNYLDDREDEYLPFYGLYNVETESGFSSYKIETN